MICSHQPTREVVFVINEGDVGKMAIKTSCCTPKTTLARGEKSMEYCQLKALTYVEEDQSVFMAYLFFS